MNEGTDQDLNKQHSLLKKSSLKYKQPIRLQNNDEFSKETEKPKVVKKPTFKLNDEVVLIKPIEEERVFANK